MTKTLIVLPAAQLEFNGSQRDAQLYLAKLGISGAQVIEIESAPPMSPHLPAALNFIQKHGTTLGGFNDFRDEFMIAHDLPIEAVHRLFDEARVLFKATLTEEAKPTDDEVRALYKEQESLHRTVVAIRRQWPTMGLSEAIQQVKRVAVTAL